MRDRVTAPMEVAGNQDILHGNRMPQKHKPTRRGGENFQLVFDEAVKALSKKEGKLPRQMHELRQHSHSVGG